jgi:hypothetical protein
MRFLHFANNDVIETYQGNKIIQNWAHCKTSQ